MKPQPKRAIERTDLLDTSLEAHRRLIRLLRQMTPEERVRRTFEMMESSRELRRIAESHDRLADRRDI